MSDSSSHNNGHFKDAYAFGPHCGSFEEQMSSVVGPAAKWKAKITDCISKDRRVGVHGRNCVLLTGYG